VGAHENVVWAVNIGFERGIKPEVIVSRLGNVTPAMSIPEIKVVMYE
jgi:hypothetical protein